MIFELLKWDGVEWFAGGLLVGALDLADAYATLRVLGVPLAGYALERVR